MRSFMLFSVTKYNYGDLVKYREMGEEHATWMGRWREMHTGFFM
jgi:hypothetical protein